ncbi:hypothetical protein J056_001761 [Wallemia ichthyophaga EXF-994]|uniref:Uncharacterized protein n=1 Tax=Wallemia ichthyophaga (strain EXF-994 / CBS 113033) TaxID=1299270 RepID=R9AB34_WALI9|nr:uncharacterized protein J056_001761 [Wallemia ichthyophaga EXF-994]EOQ99438.1 hypothetical protein J056_001761 [Wallemia ichthyophaga EXF-994]
MPIQDFHCSLPISIFPLAWSSIWALYENLSANGRQGSWTPLGSFFDEILPFAGQLGINIAVASTSLIITTVGLIGWEKIFRYLETPMQLQMLTLHKLAGTLPSLKKAIILANEIAHIGITLKSKQHPMDKSTTILLWVECKGVKFEYWKRNIVPIAESFSTSAGIKDPLNVIIPLPDVSRNHSTRLELRVSGGMCFDGAFQMRYADLQLYPAETWDVAVSEQMYLMTKAHAREAYSAL